MTNSEAVVSEKKRFSMVWIVPIVAILLGAWMVVHNYQNQGPEIILHFANADGIQAGKTQIKTLSVSVGMVNSVEINPNFDGVLVHAQLDKKVEPLLHSDSQFWVVRPRIGASGVSGLGTLLSGAYIELAPGNAKELSHEFIGLDDVPQTPANTPGIHVTLVYEDGASVGTGEPILYRGFQVGRVEKTEFDTKEQVVRSYIFVDAPYSDLITSNTRFWNTSGISINMDSKGVRIDSGSVESILVGGIAFSLPEDTEPGKKVTNGAIFNLFPDHASINVVNYEHGMEYLLLFNSSVRGLAPGAPVNFRGIEIGQVLNISFDYLPQDFNSLHTKTAPIPVLIRITPASLTGDDSEAMVQEMQENIGRAINSGLRASLKNGSLITGSLFISLDFLKDPPPVTATTLGDYHLIPTASGGLDQIQTKITSILDKINALPLKKTVVDADEMLLEIQAAAANAKSALAHIDTLMASDKTQQLPDEVTTTLQQLRDSLSQLANDFSAGSPVYSQLGNNLDQLQQTLHSVEQLTNQLGSQPNSLIFSDPRPADQTPESAR